MKKKIPFPVVVAVLYALLFAYTGIYKLAYPATFRADLDGSPLSPFSGLLVWIVPIGEMVLAGVLLVPRWRGRGLQLAVVLMAFFTVFFLFLSYSYPSVSCPCGGFIERMGPLAHLLLNLGFISFGLAGIIRSRAASNILRVQNSPPAAGKGIADSL